LSKSGWIFYPAAFFLLFNYAVSEVKHLFFLRLAYFLFLFFLAVLLSRFRLHGILAPLSAGIALTVFVYGILQKFVIFPWILAQPGWEPSPFSQALRAIVASGRVFAIFPLPTLYAAVCGLLLVCIIHYFFQARGRSRLFWAALFLLGALNLFLTQSFGGIFFFTAAALFYLFASGIFKVKYLAPLLMAAALLFFLVVTLRFAEARGLKPVKLRFANWQQAGRLIGAAPLLGVGLGNYETSVPARVFPNEPASIYAHNFFLQMAAEIGLPFFLFMLLFAAAWMKRNFRRAPRGENALFGALCMLLFFFSLMDVGIYFFAAGLAFSIAVSQIFSFPGGSRPRYLLPAGVLAAMLAIGALSADRQRTADLELARGEAARAGKAYGQALRLNPWSYRAWLGRAAIARAAGRNAEAERMYGRVLEIYPGQAYANYMLSQAASRRGAYLTAMAHARRAAQANRKNNEYQRWYESVQAHFTDRLALPGN
jgi:tetratricopeptide (TPR) repeat protein